MLEIVQLTKRYDEQPLLRGVSFTVQAGETLCLLGASGSGKSTILRIIAGLESADFGEVAWQGESLMGVPVHKRNFGLMFQDYALFPHLDVAGNVAFGLRMQNWPADRADARVAEVLEMTNLTGFARRKVTELSGGEQQRVALARALAPRPRLLMLDEPLGALDRALRESLIQELRRVLHQSGIPAIYVTHDQQEAFTIADTILLLNGGAVVQAGSPAEVYGYPANAWAAGFLGLGNLLEGRQTSQGVETSSGLFGLDSGMGEGAAVTVLLRPQAELVAQGETLSGRVRDVVFLGRDFKVELDNGMSFLLSQSVRVGDVLRLKVAQVQLI